MKDSPGLVDGKLVRGTDCDTLFFKVLAGEEGQKKLDFRMFGNALRRMAQLRYPDLQVRKRRREAGKKQHVFALSWVCCSVCCSVCDVACACCSVCCST